MENLLDDYAKQAEELNEYFKFVQLVDKLDEILLNDTFLIYNEIHLSEQEYLTGTFSITEQHKRINKANCYLLLYNLVEGTITRGIDAIFLAINNRNIKLKNLNPTSRKLFLNYKGIPHKLENKHRQDITNYFNYLMDEEVEFKHSNKEGYEAYKEKAGGEISGNIDMQKLKELSEKYGFLLPDENQEKVSEYLDSIKRKRNQLAHGEISFVEAGKTVAIEELILIKNSIINYLEIFLKNIEEYISEEEYR